MTKFWPGIKSRSRLSKAVKNCDKNAQDILIFVGKMIDVGTLCDGISRSRSPARADSRFRVGEKGREIQQKARAASSTVRQAYVRGKFAAPQVQPSRLEGSAASAPSTPSLSSLDGAAEPLSAKSDAERRKEKVRITLGASAAQAREADGTATTSDADLDRLLASVLRALASDGSHALYERIGHCSWLSSPLRRIER